jgi:hypothetical protein
MIRSMGILRMVLAAAILCVFAAPASANIKVNKKPIVIKHHEFDPRNPPKELPPMNAGEIAVCWSQYDAAVQLAMQPATRRQASGKYSASLTVTAVTVELTCQVDVWLPKGANAKLTAHEEGHRAITEKVYAEVADKAAKVAADKLDGRRYNGEGDSAAEAEKDANEKLTAAHTAMIKAYLAETSTAGKTINDAFDELTAHGANRLEEAKAMEQAWAAHTPPMWVQPKAAATKPATRKN